MRVRDPSWPGADSREEKEVRLHDPPTHRPTEVTVAQAAPRRLFALLCLLLGAVVGSSSVKGPDPPAAPPSGGVAFAGSSWGSWRQPEDASPSGPTVSEATGTPSAQPAGALATPYAPPASAHAPSSTRNKYLWPFASTSIWNTPIGSGAVYVPAGLPPRTLQTLVSDQDVIVMDPTSPLTPIDYNGSGWSGQSRCPGGKTLASVPIPSAFTVPSDGHNDALAVVMPDGRTVIQGQPFARCSPGGPATVLSLAPSADLYGDGILGGHGGSGLSSLGGTIRLGELVPGGQIHHVLKIDLDGATDLFPRGYRWPAIRQDGCAPGCYGGLVPALQMGALLALPTSVGISSLGLETQPGRMLAWTLQNYGAYVVDDATRSVFSICTEVGPSGSVVQQFQQVWGFPFDAPVGSTTPWSHDINMIFSHLSVVANNGPDSIGGGGTPLQPPAPPIGN